jgi:glutamate carboxypeptidase
MALSNSERAVCEAAAAAPLLDRTLAWAAINSGSRNLAGLKTMAGMLADAFAVLPGDVALVPPAPVDAVGADGSIAPIAHGDHLLVTVRPDAPVQLLFTGHYDTVFPADHPFQSVALLDDGRVNGPGVADMKGGIALMLAALAAVEESPLAPRFGYQVLIDSDEEVGSPSSAALIARVAKGKAAAFTYEPALPDGTLAGARGGSGNFSFIISGRSAHAGRNPEDGLNAVLAAADLALRLEAAAGDGLSVNPARIEGGGPNNVVPDHAVLRVNLRPRTPADQARAQAAIDSAVAAVAAARGVGIHVHGGFGRPPKPMEPAAERLFMLVKDCGADLGLSIGWRATGGVCDGNNIAATGVPVIDTMGVRGGAIHSAEEYLIPESLPERAMLSTLAILRLIERGRA